MEALMRQIEEYWSRRAESFAEGMFEPLSVRRWLNVLLREFPQERDINILDIGTGPGFFAVSLAKLGYQVTAVDYTERMLDIARENAGDAAGNISFRLMDAQKLDFEDNCFDVIVTRNVTWNLPDPQRAYSEWFRVLKNGGMLLNFDAGWYEYLFDGEKAAGFKQDRDNVAKNGMRDHNDYDEAWKMEEISRKLAMSRFHRPDIDLSMLMQAGFSRITVDTDIWREVWSKEEKVNYGSTPMFMLKAVKRR